MISTPFHWHSCLRISPQVPAAFVVDDLPSILWCEHDVVLAEPLRVREAVGLLGHGNRLPLGAGDLNNHHARGEGVLLRSNWCPPPAERVVFYAARTARHGLKPMKRKSLRSNAGTEARSSYLLTNVAGGFAVTLVRNETQQHSAALKSAGQNPVSLLPLND